jgi:HTH-type transcriptional regulator/antitoxin HigA
MFTFWVVTMNMMNSVSGINGGHIMSVAIDWSMVAPEFRAETRKTVAAIVKLLGMSPLLSGIRSDEAYEHGLALYESVLAVAPDEADIKADVSDEAQAMKWFEALLADALADYAETRWPIGETTGGSPAAIIRSLMDQYELSQSDLPELGSQGIVSEILNGKRNINLRQIKALSQRFNIPQHFLLGD